VQSDRHSEGFQFNSLAAMHLGDVWGRARRFWVIRQKQGSAGMDVADTAISSSCLSSGVRGRDPEVSEEGSCLNTETPVDVRGGVSKSREECSERKAFMSPEGSEEKRRPAETAVRDFLVTAGSISTLFLRGEQQEE
jgi:hypothetical protein